MEKKQVNFFSQITFVLERYMINSNKGLWELRDGAIKIH